MCKLFSPKFLGSSKIKKTTELPKHNSITPGLTSELIGIFYSLNCDLDLCETPTFFLSVSATILIVKTVKFHVPSTKSSGEWIIKWKKNSRVQKVGICFCSERSRFMTDDESDDTRTATTKGQVSSRNNRYDNF